MPPRTTATHFFISLFIKCSQHRDRTEIAVRIATHLRSRIQISLKIQFRNNRPHRTDRLQASETHSRQRDFCDRSFSE
jgi:hypothetical protein